MIVALVALVAACIAAVLDAAWRIVQLVQRWRVRRRGFPAMDRRQLVMWAVSSGVEPRWWESSRRLRQRVRESNRGSRHGGRKAAR